MLNQKTWQFQKIKKGVADRQESLANSEEMAIPHHETKKHMGTILLG